MPLQILLNAAIGDAWAVCFEYAPRHIIESRINSWGYFPHHKYNIGNGRYSDDLQMHMAVAEVLLNDPPYEEMKFIESFVHAFQRDPREGYAGRFYEFLQTVTDAQDFAAHIRPQSEKSGGAMRAACIGIFSDVTQVLGIAATQAKTTHNTPRGIAAAQAAALMLHYLLYNKGPRRELPNFLCEHIPDENWRDHSEVKIGHLGVDSVRAALRTLTTENTLTGILKAIVRCGGDTDTAATIAMAAASCAKDIDQTIPEPLLNGLEDGPYGKTYIMELDNKLTNVARQQGAPEY